MLYANILLSKFQSLKIEFADKYLEMKKYYNISL